MPRVDEQAGEINIKIVYHGAGLSGRTMNLLYIYNKTRPEAKGKMISIASETERELFFDFKPLTMPPVRGLRLRVHLHTSPGSVYIKGAKERVLRGADGIVFVANSQAYRSDANIETMENLETEIARQGRDLAALPLVLQYNMRDRPDVVPVAELDALLNRQGRPAFTAVALTGQGVFDTLKSIVRQVLARLGAVP